MFYGDKLNGLIPDLESSDRGVQCGHVHLGGASEARQEVVTPLGQGNQVLVEDLQPGQVGLQQLKSGKVRQRGSRVRLKNGLKGWLNPDPNHTTASNPRTLTLG